MEARKVQITGKSTYMITLPKKWANDRRLGAGDLVLISVEDDGSLHLFPPDYIAEPSSKTIKIEEDLDKLIRNIIGAYVMGHQTITITSGKIGNEAKKAIINICKNLVGSEITEVTDNKIVIRDLLDSGEFGIEKGFKRMYNIVSSMLECLISTLSLRSIDKIEEIISRDDEVDRIFLLVSKLYNCRLKENRVFKGDKLTLLESFYYRLAAENLERAADHTAKIAGILKDSEYLPDDALKEIRHMLQCSLEIFDTAVTSLQKSDIELADRALKENIKVKEDMRVLDISSSDTSVTLPLGMIVDSIIRIGDYASNIAEIAIDISQR